MRDTLLILFGVLSLIGFVLTYVDKQKAIRHQWRIPEKTFYFLGLLGGAIGIWAGMFLFHHKTRKGTFVGVLLVDLLVNLIVFYQFK
ncbi:MAG: DUF1294 domain-containing protein [Erysipelotrichaceae bacterium]